MLKFSLLTAITIFTISSPGLKLQAEDFDDMWRRGNFYERTKAVLKLHQAGELALDTPRANSWRRAAQKTLHYFSWDERLLLNEVAEALNQSELVKPTAMNVRKEALAAEGEASIELLGDAMDAGAALSEADYLHWAEAALAVGDDEDARDKMLMVPSYRRSSQGLAVRLATLPEPKVRPKVLLHSLVGGAGDQRITKIEVMNDGSIAFVGKGFTATFLPETEQVHVTGDISVADERARSGAFLAKGWKKTSKEVQVLEDPNRDQTYRWFTWQVAKLLQQPYVSSSDGWQLWGWSNSEAEKASLMADSRIWRIWMRPDGLLGGLGWTDGGNTVFAKDPKNLGKRGVMKGFGKGPRAVIFTIDPDQEGAVTASRTFHGVVPNHYADPWGRLILGGPKFSRAAGYSIIDTSFKPIAGAPLGASEIRGVSSSISAMVQVGPYLLLGGSSNAPKIKGKSMIQKKSGGGHDALIAVVKLW